MKSDTSRNTFRPERHYRDVVKQQGRVDVDADWNEQQSINVRRTETEAIDVIGATGAPLHAAGFTITTDGTTLRIGAGRYYVDGILCENDRDGLDYREQPDRPNVSPLLEELKQAGTAAGIIYLDVWLRHITALNDPLIREVALGGPDTCTRTQVVWQVRMLPVVSRPPDRDRLARLQARQAELQARIPAMIAAGADIGPSVQELAEVNREIAELLAAFANPPLSCSSKVPAWDELTAPSKAKLNARTSPTPPTTDLCSLPPRAGYQRIENQLYRVEVHRRGPLGKATFKWSRDNGSVLTAVEEVSGQDIVVRSTGPDQVLGLLANNWVEVIDDASELTGTAGSLLQIDHIPDGSRTLTMKTTPAAVIAAARPLLRRWDQSGTTATSDGVVITGDWQPLEDGVEVKFSDGPFEVGDYWLIPARASTGDVEWPPYEIPNTDPIAQPRRGIEHHFSRLAVVQIDNRALRVTADCRKIFPPLTEITASAPKELPAMHVKGTSWRNDAPLSMSEFLERGLLVDFDRLPDPLSVTAKTMSVSLELPIIPDTGFEAAGNREVAPRVSVLLFGEITLQQNQVRWLPLRKSLLSLATFYSGLRQVVGRVLLKGAAIWATENDRPVYLDGRAFGVPSRGDDANGSQHIDLAFPSGSEERASDFESWFLLGLPIGLKGFTIEPPTVRLIQQGNEFFFASADTPRPQPVEVVATLALTAPAPSDLVITLRATENREFVQVPERVGIPAGANATRFALKPGQRPADAATRVAIVASAEGAEVTATLTVLPRG